MKNSITKFFHLAQVKVEAIGTNIEPLKVFCAIFGLSAVAGISLLLTDKKRKLGFRVILGSFLISGVIGLIIALIWWSKFGQTDLFFLIGVSTLAGMGGNNTLGLAYIVICRKFGLENVIKELYKNNDDEGSDC